MGPFFALLLAALASPFKLAAVIATLAFMIWHGFNRWWIVLIAAIPGALVSEALMASGIGCRFSWPSLVLHFIAAVIQAAIVFGIWRAWKTKRNI